LNPEKNAYRILKELLKNPKGSDRQVATKARVSQPTVTRTRARLIAQGIIQSYEIIPDLAKLGFEIIAFSLVKGGTNIEEVREDQSIIWSLDTTQGIFYVSVHKDFKDFMDFGRHADIMILASTHFDAIKPLSFKDLPF